MAKLAHAQWSSRMGFVLAAAGSAVGLGNIWRFSYMVGDSGGAAFVLVYLACVALVGLPILVAEWMIGRRGQKNPINTMSDLASRIISAVAVVGMSASPVTSPQPMSSAKARSMSASTCGVGVKTVMVGPTLTLIGAGVPRWPLRLQLAWPCALAPGIPGGYGTVAESV